MGVKCGVGVEKGEEGKLEGGGEGAVSPRQMTRGRGGGVKIG